MFLFNIRICSIFFFDDNFFIFFFLPHDTIFSVSCSLKTHTLSAENSAYFFLARIWYYYLMGGGEREAKLPFLFNFFLRVLWPCLTFLDVQFLQQNLDVECRHFCSNYQVLFLFSSFNFFYFYYFSILSWKKNYKF